MPRAEPRGTREMSKLEAGMKVSVAGVVGTVESVEQKRNGVWVVVDGKRHREAAVTVVVDPSERVCECGCGLAVAKRSVFRQGHDQRMKGQLLRRHDQGDAEATAELLRRGWRTQAELGRRKPAKAEPIEATA